MGQWVTMAAISVMAPVTPLAAEKMRSAEDCINTGLTAPGFTRTTRYWFPGTLDDLCMRDGRSSAGEKRYVDMAVRADAFINSHLVKDGRLMVRYRDGDAGRRKTG